MSLICEEVLLVPIISEVEYGTWDVSEEASSISGSLSLFSGDVISSMISPVVPMVADAFSSGLFVVSVVTRVATDDVRMMQPQRKRLVTGAISSYWFERNNRI